MADTADMVLLTVNEHETRETQLAFGRLSPVAVTKGSYRYWDYGEIAGARVVHAQCEMADLPAGKVARAALDSWKPGLLVAVGIAWGARQDKQAIGDLLFAAPLRDAAHRGDLATGIEPRGKPFPQTDSLLQVAKSCYKDWPQAQAVTPAKLHVGEVLSLPTLLDNAAERERLLKAFPNAIGGEMEGRGMADAAEERKCDWLLLKAVCDWGMGKNADRVQKELDQQLGAKNSAAFLRFAVENGLAHLAVRQRSSSKAFATAPSSNSVTMTIGTVTGGTVIGNAETVNIGARVGGSKNP